MASIASALPTSNNPGADWVLHLRRQEAAKLRSPQRAQRGDSQGSKPASFPEPSELPRQPSVPDPLVMLDGRKVTTLEMWMKERRPELIRLFQHYIYGQLPPSPALSATVQRVEAAALGGKATLSEVTLRFGARSEPAR